MGIGGRSGTSAVPKSTPSSNHAGSTPTIRDRYAAPKSLGEMSHELWKVRGYTSLIDGKGDPEPCDHDDR